MESKNLFELESIINSWDSCVKFLNRSIPFFPKEEVMVKPREQKVLTLKAPFVEEISGMAITKMLDIKEQKTLTMKLKFIRNRAIFKVTNSTHETVTFHPKENTLHYRFKVIRLLQDKTGSLAAKP